jgi:hypothetical protein
MNFIRKNGTKKEFERRILPKRDKRCVFENCGICLSERKKGDLHEKKQSIVIQDKKKMNLQRFTLNYNMFLPASWQHSNRHKSYLICVSAILSSSRVQSSRHVDYFNRIILGKLRYINDSICHNPDLFLSP